MPLVRRRDDLTFSFVHSIDNLHQPLDLKIGVDDFVDSHRGRGLDDTRCGQRPESSMP
jgi:hypothetical protein